MARFFLVFFFLTLAFHSGWADLTTATPPSKEKRPAPEIVGPTARAAEASGEVERGGRTSMLLRGISSAGGLIEFRILRSPAAGRILSSKRVGEDALEVVYQHGGSQRSRKDSFVFGVRRQGIGPFSPGEATLTVTDQSAKLAGPEMVQFTAVEIGQTDTQDLVITNDGGLPASGEMQVSTPWQIVGPGGYRIAGGGSRKVTLQFAPDSPGEIAGRLLLQGDDVLEIPLKGTASAPFSVLTPKVVLQPEPGGGRAGMLVLQNNTAHPVEVKLISDLPLEQTLSLKFGETQEVPIRVAGGPQIEARLELSAGHYQVSVPLSGSPSPAQIEVISGQDVEVPALKAGQSVRLMVRLKNSGGLPATIKVAPSEHLQVAEPKLKIESNGEADLQVLAVGPETGDLRETLVLQSGGQTLEVHVQGRAVGSSTTVAPLSAVAVAEQTPALKPDASEARVEKRLPRLSRGHVFPLKVVEQQKKSLRLRWSAPLPQQQWSYRLEYRLLKPEEKGGLQMLWTPVPDLPIAAIDGGFEAKVDDLEPQTVWTFRVVATPRGGGPPLTSAPLTSRTLPAFHLQIPWRWLLVAASLLTGALVLRQRWRERPAGF